MKNITTIIQVILIAAVLGLYGLYFSKNSETKKCNSTARIASGDLSIAYVKMDSLLINYKFAQDLHEEFTGKSEAYNKEFATKRVKFEREAASFQEKIQKGGFTSQQRAIQERDRLAGVEQEIKKMDYELSNKLAEMQAQNNRRIVDTINHFLDEFNAEANYTYIINASSVLKGQEPNNITAEILEKLNTRYEAMK